ncbi:hypothetical protein GQ43DRAFT_444085 [Delitschia confertaspora ATCC 74209]|uniref:Uncharacterized protein n=1 Tax=Delitschia confertaspora ATCC 74209 TaxID=1513339 RepID=A0A9P4JI43_9PLEO|nr:hypothetical protein GQ43DRAFT_444085 [Delitschia confertaspora ATCC 74209]
MDLFTFDPWYQVLVCKPYGYAVPPSCLASHVSTVLSLRMLVATPVYPTLGLPNQFT